MAELPASVQAPSSRFASEPLLTVLALIWPLVAAGLYASIYWLLDSFVTAPGAVVARRVCFTALLVAGSGTYLAGYRLLCAPSLPKVYRRIIVGSAVVPLVALIPAPPLLSTDVYNYILYGRLWAFGIGNPLTTPPYPALVGDPFLSLAHNVDWPNPYGPVAGLAFAGLAALKLPDLATFLVFKAAAPITVIGVALLAARLAEPWGTDRELAAFLIVWNPVVMLEFGWQAHNDGLMVLLTLCGLLLLRRNHRFAGLLVVGLAAAVKLPVLLLVPMLVAVLRDGPPTRLPFTRRQWGYVFAALGGLAIPYAVVWAGPETLGGLGLAASRFHRFTVAYWLASALSGSGLSPGTALWTARVILLAGFGMVAYAIMRRSMSLQQAVAGYSTAMMVYILVVQAHIESWYVFWVLPFAAVSWQRKNVLRLGLGAVFLAALYLFRPRFVGLF